MCYTEPQLFFHCPLYMLIIYCKPTCICVRKVLHGSRKPRHRKFLLPQTQSSNVHGIFIILFSQTIFIIFARTRLSLVNYKIYRQSLKILVALQCKCTVIFIVVHVLNTKQFNQFFHSLHYFSLHGLIYFVCFHHTWFPSISESQQQNIN